MRKEKDFIGITNREVYDKLLHIERKLDGINTKVKVNRWISTTSLSLFFLLLGFMIASL